MTSVQMENEMQHSMRFPTKASMILFFLKGSIKWFFLSAIFTGMASLLEMTIPKLISFMVDSLVGESAVDIPAVVQPFLAFAGNALNLQDRRSLIAFVAGIVALVALFRFVFRFLFSDCSVRAAESFVKHMRDELFGHILYLPFAWLGENNTGDLIQRCTSDIETVKRSVLEQLTGLIQIITLVFMAVGFMGSIDMRIMIISVVFIPLIAGYSVYFYSAIGKAFEETAKEESSLSTIVQENLSGVRVIRAFGRENFENTKFMDQNGKYTEKCKQLSMRLSAFNAIENLLAGIQTLVVITAGAVFAAHGELTSGDYIALLSYMIVIVGPEKSLGHMMSEMSRAWVSVDRLRYIMNEIPERDEENAVTPPMDRDIVFDHVSFSYGKESDDVLCDVSFKVPAGSTCGILGGTGAGKSTLMYLLTRLYELPKENGIITVGGVDIADIRLSYLRKNIGLVLQEPYLFSGTLKENIAMAEGTGDMDKIRSSAGVAGIDDAIRQFDDGYDTVIGERGVMLSGGQKQRTAIAQMLIRKTPVMIFDDSLSSVDTETDMKIRSRLKENSGSATVIMVSHRITTLMHADHIIVLDKGRICEEGTHEELLASGGLYRKVYDLQAGGRA